MKKRGLFKLILSCLAPALAVTACNTGDNVEQHYIKLSDSAIALPGDGNLTATVKVYAVPSVWDAEANASWLKVINRTSNSFDIVAEVNEDGLERSTQVIVKSGDMQERITVRQVPKDFTFRRYYFFKNFLMGSCMSASGKYVGSYYYQYPEGSSQIEYVPVIIDVETNTWHELGPYPGTLVQIMQPMAMSDDGLLVVDTERNGNVTFDLEDNMIMLKPPTGFTKIPQIASISADGVWVGWSGKNGTSYPFKWVDGVAQELPKPALNFRDEPIGDVQARGISANGKIIYGTTWDNEDYGMVYWDENNEVRYVGEDVHEVWEVERTDIHGNPYKYNLANGMWTSDTRYNVSPDGKWIAGGYRTEKLTQGPEGEEVARVTYPAFYNTETRKTTIFYDLPGAAGIAVTNEGLGFTGNDVTGFPASGDVVDINSQIVIGSAIDWVKENYGINIVSGYIQYIPEGGDTVFGIRLFVDGPSPMGLNWLITPEM